MKFLSISLLALSALCSAAGLKADVIKWDFSKGIQPDSKKVKFTLHEATTDLKDGYLRAKTVSRKTFSGITADRIAPELTPKSAFRLTVEFTMEAPRNKDSLMFFWDNKGDFDGDKTGKPGKNSGFTVGMYRTPNGKVIVPRAWLGFGTKTANLKGLSFSPVFGKKHVLEFYYNGSGMAAFYIDGALNKEVTVEPGGALAPARYKTAIGNRAVGNFFGFDGKIHSVKLTTSEAEFVRIRSVSRKVFRRLEKNAALKIEVRNVSRKNIVGLKPGEKKIFNIPVETNLVPGEYKAAFVYQGKKIDLPYTVAPFFHEKLPIIMWSFSDSFHILRKSGFTHMLDSLVSRRYWRPLENPKEKILAQFDEMYKYGFHFSDYYTIPHFPNMTKKYPRLKRDGTPVIKIRKKNLDANNPEAKKYIREWAEKSAALYDFHPAINMLDVCSEIRDRTAPSFTKYERDACKAGTGADIPDCVSDRVIHYKEIPNFPASRIIPDDHYVLKYYRWFWEKGDGWNPMFSSIADGYRKYMHKDFKCYFAPATRQPPLRTVGGNVDLLGQWTYSNPEPLVLAASADELLATANGKPVIQGTQLILYRSITAPKGVKVSPEPAWMKTERNASYVTNPPDTLIQSIWATLSRPVSGMVFHGDGSFYPAPVKGFSAYRMTNPQAEPAFRKMMEEVIQPLGPALLKVKGKNSDVAILHSFTSSVLALRGSYGHFGWLTGLHIALQTANFQPHVIYEEDIQEGKLKDVKILFLSHCDILPESIYKKLSKFQADGGIIVADETVPPAIMPNLRFKTFPRDYKDTVKHKQNIVNLGADLRKKLGKHFKPVTETTSPDMISHLRDNYLFVINDKRTFGDYLGQWKMFAEKALPNSGTVTVHKKISKVYDLVNRKAVAFKQKGSKIEIPVSFTGAGGKLYLLLEKDFGAMKLNVNKNSTVTADFGTNVTVPVQLIVRDAKGKLTDDSGYTVAVNGKFQYKIVVPKNAAKGNWTVELKRLADNKSVKGILRR